MTKLRQYFYLGSGAIAGILPLLLFFKLIDAGQAASITDLVGSIGSLLGAGGAITAGVILGKQRKDGTLDPVEEMSAADKVINGWQELNASVEAAKAELTKAQETIGAAPILGPLANQALDRIRF